MLWWAPSLALVGDRDTIGLTDPVLLSVIASIPSTGEVHVSRAVPVALDVFRDAGGATGSPI